MFSIRRPRRLSRVLLSRAPRYEYRQLSSNCMKYAYLSCSTALLLAALAGCATSHEKTQYSSLTPQAHVITNIPTVTVKTPLNPALLRPDGSPFTLGPGDSLDLEIVGTPTSRATTKLG